MKKLSIILLTGILYFTGCTDDSQTKFRICSECNMKSSPAGLYPVDTNKVKDGKPDIYVKCSNFLQHPGEFKCGEEVKLIFDSTTGKSVINTGFIGEVCPIYKSDFCTNCD